MSTIELLRDDARRMTSALERADVPVTLSEWSKVSSMWHIFAAGLPEARDAIRAIGTFLRDTTRHAPGKSPRAAP